MSISSAMPQYETLRLNTDAESAMLKTTGIASSFFRPNDGKEVGCEFKMERLIVNNGDKHGPGKEARFEVNKTSTGIHKVALRISMPPLASVVTGGTFARLSDFAILAILRDYTVTNSVNSIRTSFPIADYMRSRLCGDETRKAFDFIHRGSLTAAQRNTAALGRQELDMCLDVPWCQENAMEQKGILPNTALANKVSFLLRFADASKFIETDGVIDGNFDFIAVNLRPYVIHTTADVRDSLTMMAASPEGINWGNKEYQRIQITVPAGDLVPGVLSELPLKGFRGPVSSFHVFVRTRDQIDNARPFEFDNSLSDGWQTELNGSGLRIYERHDKQENNGVQLALTHHGVSPNINHIRLGFDAFPQRQNVSSGSVSTGNIDNFMLGITPVSTNTETLILDIIGCRHNWLNQTRGSLISIWG